MSFTNRFLTLGPLLRSQLTVPIRQSSPEPLTVQDHRDKQEANSQAYKCACNKHVGETIAFHPWDDAERDTDTDDVADKSYGCEGVTGNL